MYTLDELKRQNNEISDLIDVLSVLVNHQELYKNPFVCELVSSFNEKVWMHLVFEENTIYSELAKHHNPDISRIAETFHESARAIRKIFTGYVKLWCQTSTDDGNHEAFVKQSSKIFQLLRERVDYESSEMFPLIERHFDS